MITDHKVHNAPWTCLTEIFLFHLLPQFRQHWLKRWILLQQAPHMEDLVVKVYLVEAAGDIFAQPLWSTAAQGPAPLGVVSHHRQQAKEACLSTTLLGRFSRFVEVNIT